MKFSERPLIFLATGCFVGNIPLAPGTFGSIWGIPLSYLISRLNVWYELSVIASFCGLAVVVAHKAEQILAESDPASIVIDEIAGLLVAFWGLPFNFFTVISGFVFFRIFDIAKPMPIKFVEKKMPGGWGIVLDDLMAGVYANLTVRLVYWVLGIGY